MMPILWLKFPDEIVSSHNFEMADKERFEKIFSLSDYGSPLQKAIRSIGLKLSNDNTMVIKWYHDKPYFNWTWLAEIISGGALRTIKNDTGYSFAFNTKVKDIIGLISSQWKMTKFLVRKENKNSDKLTESIALGLALQSLIIRLGDNSGNMDRWLASPLQAPKKYNKLLEQIQKVQMRRTALSSIWHELFSKTKIYEDVTDLPEFFWDDDIRKIEISETTQQNNKNKWQGRSVCAGQVTGLAYIVPLKVDIGEIEALKNSLNAPLILIFKNARPETTELFRYADAVIYITGGILSHACTVAREMNIPAITEAGQNFHKFISDQSKCWLTIDGLAGTVELIEQTE